MLRAGFYVALHVWGFLLLEVATSTRMTVLKLTFGALLNTRLAGAPIAHISTWVIGISAVRVYSDKAVALLILRVMHFVCVHGFI